MNPTEFLATVEEFVDYNSLPRALVKGGRLAPGELVRIPRDAKRTVYIFRREDVRASVFGRFAMLDTFPIEGGLRSEPTREQALRIGRWIASAENTIFFTALRAAASDVNPLLTYAVLGGPVLDNLDEILDKAHSKAVTFILNRDDLSNATAFRKYVDGCGNKELVDAGYLGEFEGRKLWTTSAELAPVPPGEIFVLAAPEELGVWKASSLRVEERLEGRCVVEDFAGAVAQPQGVARAIRA